jgi:uncharacterized protein (TIGR00251 family)
MFASMDVSDLYRIENAQTTAGEGGGENVGENVGENIEEVETADVVLQVHVQPGAGRSAVVGRHGAALKVRVAAPPEQGRANEATGTLLGETFGVKPSEVELIGGATSRSKQFRLRGVDPEEFRRQLERAVAAKAARPSK